MLTRPASEWLRRLAEAAQAAAAALDRPRQARALTLFALGCGLAVRLAFSQDAHLSVDLGTAYAVAHDIAHGRALPVWGGTVSWGGTWPLPGYPYLLVPPLWVSDSPRLFFLWGALLASAGLVPFSLLLWERYGPRAAVLGTWMVAFAPWFVVLGDSGWSPKIAMSIVALLLYALHRTAAHDRSRWIAAVPLALTAQAHVYPNLPVTVAMVAGAWAAARPRANGRWLLLGIAASALTLVPTAWGLAAGAPADLGGWFSHPRPFDRLVETAEAVYHSVAFASGEIGYLLELGFWGDHGVIDRAAGGLAGLARGYGSTPRALYAAATLALAAFAWTRALALALRRRDRRPRERDPMAAALLGALAASVLIVAGGVREYHVRYNCAIAWLAVLPVLWMVAGPRPIAWRWGRRALTAWILVSCNGGYQMAAAYYRRAVPPYGVTTAAQAMEIIVREQRGRPFALRYPHPYARRGVHLMGGRLYGRAWTLANAAPVRYSVLAPSYWPRARHLATRPGVRVWPLRRGVLVATPRPAGAPGAARPPPPAGLPGTASPPPPAVLPGTASPPPPAVLPGTASPPPPG